MDERLVYWDLTTPDGTVMRSTHVHDYRTYTDANGKEYMVDGGNAYIRCSAHGDEAIFSITEADIPRIKSMQQRIQELTEGLSEALYMLGAIDLDDNPSEEVLDPDPDACKPGVRRAYEAWAKAIKGER